jgi:aminomethyltransferase
MEQTTLRTTPLHDRHVALGARMMPFAGYDMPVQYAGIIEEHRAVREAAGLFDVSHMGEVRVVGPQARDFIQALVTNDVARLEPGDDDAPGVSRAMYTAMCYEAGGTVDDLLVYRFGPHEYLLVVNASNIDKDLAHIRDQLSRRGFECEVRDESDATALLALQGPRSLEIAGRVADLPLADLPYYHFLRPAAGSFLGCERVVVSRTGYTGEVGLEIYCETERAAAVWDALMDAGSDLGLQPAGLGARDTLRLESGFALYGHELTEDITPLEAGLGWVVKLDKGEFTGSDALRRQKEAGVPRRLVGFVMEERGIPRQGYAILDGAGDVIGEVTSGTQSPTLSAGIGLGLVRNDPAFTTPGSPIQIDVRGKGLAARVKKPPLHK